MAHDRAKGLPIPAVSDGGLGADQLVFDTRDEIVEDIVKWT